LEQEVKGQSYVCPACGSDVKLKNGAIRRMHFAHVQSECRASTDPETQYHLEGKAKLGQVLQQNGVPQLEYYFPATKQRADVYLKNGDKEYAFEFQCSPLNIASFTQRTKLYESIPVSPIWIIGKEKLGKMEGYMHLSPFQWLFLQNYSPDGLPYILSFCPHDSLFYYLIPEFAFNSKNTYFSIISTEQWKQDLTNLHSNKASPWKSRWLHYKMKWRYKYFLYKPHQKLRSYCYSKMHIPLSLFPAEIGLPVSSFYWFHTPIIEWQAWLYFDSIYQTPSTSIIHLPSVLKRFHYRIKQSDIKLKQLPLMKYGKYQDAVTEYLHQLVVLGVLQHESPLIYRKIIKETSLTSMEHAGKKDKIVLETLLKKR
jgi:competence CoiA-like predicted nuclease